MSGHHRGPNNQWDDEPIPGMRRNNHYRDRQYGYDRRSPSPRRNHHPPRQHSPTGCQTCRRFHNNNHHLSPPRSGYYDRSHHQGTSSRRSPSPRRHHSSHINYETAPFEPVRSGHRYHRSPSYDHRNLRYSRNSGRYSPDEIEYERHRSPSNEDFDQRFRSHGENRRRYDYSFRSPSRERDHGKTVSSSPHRSLQEMLNRNPTAQDRQRHHQNDRDSNQENAVYESRGRHEEREHRGYRDEIWNDRRSRSPSYSRSPPRHQYNFRSYRQENGVYEDEANQRPPTPTMSRASSWSDTPPQRQSPTPRASSPDSSELIESNALQAPIFASEDYQINYHMDNLSLEEKPVEADPVEAPIEEMKQESNQEAEQEDQENQAPPSPAASEDIPYHGLSVWFNAPGKRRRKPKLDSYLTRKPHKSYYLGPIVVIHDEPDDSEELPTVSDEFRQVLREEYDQNLARRMQRNEERWRWQRPPVWRSTTMILNRKFDDVANKEMLKNRGLASSHDWSSESPPTSPPQSRPPSPVLHSTLNRKIYPADYKCVDLYNNCIFCYGKHPADGCPEFKDVEKRREFLVEKKRCLRCFGHLHRHQEPCTKQEEKCKYCLDKHSEEEVLHHPALCREPKPLYGTREIPKENDDDDW